MKSFNLIFVNVGERKKVVSTSVYRRKTERERECERMEIDGMKLKFKKRKE